MADKKAKKKGPGDSWRTPPEPFNVLNKQFNFVADMACTELNKMCDIGFTEEDDSLATPWMEMIDNVSFDYAELKFVWCNPPYSDPMPWVKQACKAKVDGLGTVMLLNADHSVGWFAEAVNNGLSEVWNIIGDKIPDKDIVYREYESGRVRFLDENGNPQKGNNKPQFILIFDPFRKTTDIKTRYITLKELYGERSLCL